MLSPMSETPDKVGREAADAQELARRNRWTALGLGLLALLVYVGYFLFKALT